MRKYRTIKIYLLPLGFVFILSMIVCSSPLTITRNGDSIHDYRDDNNLERELLRTSKISGKIYINGTADWVDFRNAGNCTGHGTYLDPYVIEDLVINGEDLGNGIRIENSDVYFKIENCTVYTIEGYSGIKLNNISNGKLIDNNCSFNYKGIKITNSYNTIISGNTLNNNDFEGIIIANSYNNTISGNTAIKNGMFGIVLVEECHNNIILRNSVLGINASNHFPVDGIVLIDSDNNTIAENTVKYHNSKGIALDECNGNIISGNFINKNGVGILLTYSNYSMLSENFVDNSSSHGLSLSHSDNNTISRNIITNSYYYGILLRYSDHNVVSRNNLAGTRHECIREEYCEGNVFEKNESCDYGEVDQGIPSYSIVLLVGIIFIALLFTFRKGYKSSKKI